MIKAVFFDVYGTIAGFVPSRFQIQSEACAPFGLALTPAGVLKGYAAADAFMNDQNARAPIRQMDHEGKRRFFAEYEQLVLRGCGHEVSIETAAEIWKGVRRAPYEMATFPDVVPVMDRLRRAGLRVGVISNMDRPGTQLLADLGLTGHVDVAATSGEAHAEKPDPIIFALALEKAGVQAGEAVHVGDQVSADIEGAMRSGIHAVLIDRDGNHPWFDRCPRITSMEELPGILEAMGAKV
ncbi:MAG: HAD-IA family hydrolase [SAR202 cluster bacterium]|nr:HAD-IA family hydrolase [SAR202 cluster bacterium]